MVFCEYSLESPRRGDSNENTQYTFILKKIEKISLLCLLTWLYNKTLNGSNYPCLEHIFIVPKVFEPLKFDYINIPAFAVFLKVLFIMHLLQNSPDNRGMITLCDTRSLWTEHVMCTVVLLYCCFTSTVNI